MRAKYWTWTVRKPIKSIGAEPGDSITRFPDGRTLLHRRLPPNDGWMLALEMDGTVERVDIIPASADAPAPRRRHPVRVLTLAPRP